MKTRVATLAISLMLMKPTPFANGSDVSSAAPAEFFNKRFSINVSGTEIRNVLELIAAQSGLKLELTGGVVGKVTYQLNETTADEALKRIAPEQGLEISVTDREIFASKANGLSKSGDNVHRIPIKFANVGDIASKVKEMLAPDEKLIVDSDTNSLVFVGPKESFRRVSKFISLFDRIPKQILIEAQIVETSNNFLRDIGVSLGDHTTSMSGNQNTALASVPAPAGANLAFKYILRQLSGRAIDIRLAAAESEGQAKVISRPKVVTLNNKAATINSGISFNVKTLANVSGSVANVGSISTLGAGLTLNITPTVLGDDQIKLQVNINNSQPDEGAAVDGIPAIINNAANTNVIVKNGMTAIIAGLIKHSKSDSSGRVPFLSDIPILGYLFRSHTESDRNNEMAIFITPSVLNQNGWGDEDIETVDTDAGAESISGPTLISPKVEAPKISTQTAPAQEGQAPVTPVIEAPPATVPTAPLSLPVELPAEVKTSS